MALKLFAESHALQSPPETAGGKVSGFLPKAAAKTNASG
jgi:hypothetical protein